MADPASSIKPDLQPDIVRKLVEGHFERPIHNLKPLEGGEVARTFSFTVERTNETASREYVVRFNARMLFNFEKEAYVYDNFASPSIPIPRVIHLGRLGDVHWAITEKLPGRTLLDLPRDDYLALIPELIRVLDAIHAVRLGNRPGYGVFDGRGVAPHASWPAHLASVGDEEPDDDFFGKWHSLFRDGLLERDLFDRLHQRMMQLAQYAPTERSLVHGDYGFRNVLAQEGRITGVLDWMDARYGDSFYDVAWLDFWSPADGWRDRFEQHYRARGLEAPNYTQRLLCYQCYFALNGLKFFAKGRNQSAYGWVSARIGELLR